MDHGANRQRAPKPFDDARFDRALTRAKDKIARYLPLPAPLIARLSRRFRKRVQDRITALS